jgi:hypothetical protein
VLCITTFRPPDFRRVNSSGPAWSASARFFGISIVGRPSEMVLRRKRRRPCNAPVDFSELEATAPPHSRDTRLQLRLKAGDGSEQSPAPPPAFAAAKAFA